MIKRYTRPEMERLWSLDHKFQTWLKVELAHLSVLSREGIVPKEAFEAIKQKAAFDVQRIDELEVELKHDVIAFLTDVSERVGPESRYLHFGMTSSDLIDTAFALLLKESSDIILNNINQLLAVLKAKSNKYKSLVSIGRSHGIHAEPTIFGLKYVNWFAEFRRHKERLEAAVDRLAVGKFSGAVGTCAHLSPDIESNICKELGLGVDPVATQVIQRDRHAEFFSVLAFIASSCEKVAVEIRHLQRTEVLEVEEAFSKGQKGSSAMPHKKNPVGSENISGLARLVRSYAQAACENIPLWHERDISHSSVERVIAPDSTTLVNYMVTRLTGILDGLVVHTDRVEENLHATNGLVFSQRVLLALADKGVDRAKAYQWVQRNAMVCWKEKNPFIDSLLDDKNIREALTEKELKSCFDTGYYIRNVSQIYERVFT